MIQNSMVQSFNHKIKKIWSFHFVGKKILSNLVMKPSLRSDFVDQFTVVLTLFPAAIFICLQDYQALPTPTGYAQATTTHVLANFFHNFLILNILLHINKNFFFFFESMFYIATVSTTCTTHFKK
jgi:hypothetical protein